MPLVDPFGIVKSLESLNHHGTIILVISTVLPIHAYNANTLYNVFIRQIIRQVQIATLLNWLEDALLIDRRLIRRHQLRPVLGEARDIHIFRQEFFPPVSHWSLSAPILAFDSTRYYQSCYCQRLQWRELLGVNTKMLTKAWLICLTCIALWLWIKILSWL